MLTFIGHIAALLTVGCVLIAAVAGETALIVRRRFDAPRITKEISAAATQYVLNQRAALLSSYMHPDDEKFLRANGWTPPATAKAVTSKPPDARRTPAQTVNNTVYSPDATKIQQIRASRHQFDSDWTDPR